MAVRIELERLRERGLVELDRAGVSLTAAGRRRFRPLLDPIRAVAPVELGSLRVDRVTLAAHVARRETEPAWTLRDHAIREGATGLLLLYYGADGWAFVHDNEPVRVRNPQDAAVLESGFPDPSPGDLLLVASATDLRHASMGLWRVLFSVLDG